MSYPIVNNFINTSRTQRSRAMTSESVRSQNYNPPSPYQPSTTNFESQSENNMNILQQARALSPDDIQKLKYKIDLDKQVSEKKGRLAREYQTKLERDRKYVSHQPFGRHGHTVINQQELEEILSKGRARSPVVEMPQEFPLYYGQSNISNGNNPYDSSQQGTYNNYPQRTNYSSVPNQPPSPPRNDTNQNSTNGDFQRFYGPIPGSTGITKPMPISSSSSTTHPVRGDAHDPFLLFDPNKEGQNVFNIIPQQDLYDPWGRPGAGAPLIHQPTGQKFTRYSGSLQEKLNKPGQLGFDRRQYNGNIEEQKHDLEVERQRRQQEDMEHRSTTGNTAEWISQIENTRYPLKLHLPTTETTREYIGARNRYRSPESRSLYDHLSQQAADRARVQQINRYENSIADLTHTDVQNSWWGRSGGGAPANTTRRHNVHNSLQNPRQTYTTNHLGQLTVVDSEPPNQVNNYTQDYMFPKTSRYSNHRNFYEIRDEKNN